MCGRWESWIPSGIFAFLALFAAGIAAFGGVPDNRFLSFFGVF
jgi:hypothetical protein